MPFSLLSGMAIAGSAHNRLEGRLLHPTTMMPTDIPKTIFNSILSASMKVSDPRMWRAERLSEKARSYDTVANWAALRAASPPRRTQPTVVATKMCHISRSTSERGGCHQQEHHLLANGGHIAMHIAGRTATGCARSNGFPARKALLGHENTLTERLLAHRNPCQPCDDPSEHKRWRNRRGIRDLPAGRGTQLVHITPTSQQSPPALAGWQYATIRYTGQHGLFKLNSSPWIGRKTFVDRKST